MEHIGQWPGLRPAVARGPLTSEGNAVEFLLTTWLGYLVERYCVDPMFKQVDRGDIETKGLTAEQLDLLRDVLLLSGGWLQNGSSVGQGWSFNPPTNIDALAELSDAHGYVIDHVLVDFAYFGQSLPVDGRKRERAIARRVREPAAPGTFDFVT